MTAESKLFSVNYQVANRRQDVRMLSLGFRKGESFSLCYTDLHTIHYQEGQITLNFHNLLVKVSGRNLDRIHRALTAHSLILLNETEPDADRSQSDDAYIEEIRLVES